MNVPSRLSRAECSGFRFSFFISISELSCLCVAPAFDKCVRSSAFLSSVLDFARSPDGPIYLASFLLLPSCVRSLRSLHPSSPANIKLTLSAPPATLLLPRARLASQSSVQQCQIPSMSSLPASAQKNELSGHDLGLSTSSHIPTPLVNACSTHIEQSVTRSLLRPQPLRPSHEAAAGPRRSLIPLTTNAPTMNATPSTTPRHFDAQNEPRQLSRSTHLTSSAFSTMT